MKNFEKMYLILSVIALCTSLTITPSEQKQKRKWTGGRRSHAFYRACRLHNPSGCEERLKKREGSGKGRSKEGYKKRGAGRKSGQRTFSHRQKGPYHHHYRKKYGAQRRKTSETTEQQQSQEE